jgi:hypothetical protein
MASPSPPSSIYLNLLVRLIILGVIVFVTVTVVPTLPLSFEIKLLITLLVVFTYSILDVITATLITFKDRVCTVMC